MRPLYWVLCLLSLLPLAVVLPMAPTKIGVAIVSGWIALIWIGISFARGTVFFFVLIWVASYPYYYYLLSYPRERPLFTIDRTFIILLIINMLAERRSAKITPLNHDVRISAYLWALYLFVCFISLWGHDPAKVLPSYRSLVDGMLMPAILALYTIRYFPVLKNLTKLHTSACTLGIGLCITGLIELITGKDLFPWIGAVPMFTETLIRRADGPFEQQIVLSIVAIIVFFFVIYLRRLMPPRISFWRDLFHRAGALASLGAALLPMNRGVVLVLLPIGLVDWWSEYRLISRRAWTLFFSITLLAVIAARSFDPRLYDDRVSNPNNAYQRVAQQLETLRVIVGHPLFGVGFGLYYEVVSKDPLHTAKWKGMESMTLPHNVMMTVMSEEGSVGLFFYISAQVFLIRAMWRIRKAYPPGWLAFLYCVLVYTLIGVDFATVYYSDINLFYVFVLASLFQVQTRIAAQQCELPVFERAVGSHQPR